MIEIAMAYATINQLNGNKLIKLKTKYPVLKTRKKKVDNWWNSLSYYNKIDVGSIALHYHKITSNYRWKCSIEDKFIDLSKNQQQIVKFVFDQRHKNWNMFEFGYMLKL